MPMEPNSPNGFFIPPSPPEELEMYCCSYPNCGYQDEREINVACHEKCHNPSCKRDFPCQVCPEILGALVSFLHHMSTQHANKLFCPLCHFLARDWTEFKPHILAHSLTVNFVPKISTNLSNDVVTVLRCENCSTIFTCKESLSQHVKKCSRKFQPLQSAAKKVITADNLDRSQEPFKHPKQADNSSRGHKQLVDPGPSNHIIAQILDSSKAQISKFDCEKKGERKSLEISCVRCSSTFNSKRDLSLHRKANSCKPISRKSSPANPFHCDDCSLTFKFKSSLRRHKKTSCNYSNYVGKKDGVDKVVRIQRTRFACHNCSFTTLHAFAMRRHYRVHTGERPFKCPNLGCEYRARWIENLRRHQNESCRGRQIESTTTIIKSQEILGSDIECGNKIQVNGEDSNKITFACMLCNFIADSESSAMKHSCQHKTVVVMLNRI